MLNDLLFELGTEELPSGAVLPLANAMADHLVASLAEAKIHHGSVFRYATPRRIAVVIQDVQDMQGSRPIFRRGPAHSASMNAEGQPLPALLGFAKSCGVSVEELTLTESDKGKWWVYEATLEGTQTKYLLPDMIKDAISKLPMTKPMRWGDGEVSFARPVHWAVLIFGDEVVRMNVLGVETGRQSFGHRFLHPQAIDILSPRDYEKQLRQAYVLADFNQRRQEIVSQVKQLTTPKKMEVVMPEALLDEVTSIVEWPQALLADFDQVFLEVPAEALIASMQSHQKCFALRSPDGELLPHFVTVANIESAKPSQVIKGNEKVMRARLNDAAFFYRQDKRQKLGEYYAATANVIYQSRLGSLQDKIKRLQLLMDHLVVPLKLNQAQAFRVAELSKCDLMTGMVGEFPELEGLMGYYYALHDGEPEQVALALHEQYLPRFSTDVLPHSALGIALSLVDRLDTIVGIFAIGQKPSGVKDPFKSRRHALAIARLLISIPVELNLSTLLNETLHVYGERLTPVDQAITELKPFILDRLESFYVAQAVPLDIVRAVRARQNDWFFDMDRRIKALLAFAALPEASNLSSACKRVNHLLQHSLLPSDQLVINMALLADGAEKKLMEQMERVEEVVQPLYRTGDYVTILTELAGLHDSIYGFFEEVMVMVDDQSVRANRLSLLSRLQSLLQGVADISLL